MGCAINGTVNMICFLLDPFIQESFNPPKYNPSSNPEIYVTPDAGSPAATEEDFEKIINYKSPSQTNGYQTSATTSLQTPLICDQLQRYYTTPIAIQSPSSVADFQSKDWFASDSHLHPKYYFET